MLSIFECDDSTKLIGNRWIPAFAGMTNGWVPAFAGMTIRPCASYFLIAPHTAAYAFPALLPGGRLAQSICASCESGVS
jgi:hypothetical protein